MYTLLITLLSRYNVHVIMKIKEINSTWKFVLPLTINVIIIPLLWTFYIFTYYINSIDF